MADMPEPRVMHGCEYGISIASVAAGIMWAVISCVIWWSILFRHFNFALLLIWAYSFIIFTTIFIVTSVSAFYKLKYHRVAMRELGGNYPLLTIEGEHLMGKNGIYLTKGCIVSSGDIRGIVIGASKLISLDGQRSVDIDTGPPSGILSLPAKDLDVLRGGILPQQWHDMQRIDDKEKKIW